MGKWLALGGVLAVAALAGMRLTHRAPAERTLSPASARPSPESAAALQRPISINPKASRLPGAVPDPGASPSGSPSLSASSEPSAMDAQQPDPTPVYSDLPLEGSHESMDDANMARGEPLGTSVTDAGQTGVQAGPAYGGGMRSALGSAGAGAGAGGGKSGATSAARYSAPGGGGTHAAGAGGAQAYSGEGKGPAGLTPFPFPNKPAVPYEGRAASKKAAANRPEVTGLVLGGKQPDSDKPETPENKKAYGHTNAGTATIQSLTGAGVAEIAGYQSPKDDCVGEACARPLARPVAEAVAPPRVPESKPIKSYQAPAKPAEANCGKAGAVCSANGSGKPCCGGYSCNEVASNGGFQYFQCQAGGGAPGGKR
ncbi:MAG: hypothetical protein HY078_07030 [Elusimicrobia bacterium]|nr:hypothetical protein [Elusimicrobiota bacterium]